MDHDPFNDLIFCFFKNRKKIAGLLKNHVQKLGIMSWGLLMTLSNGFINKTFMWQSSDGLGHKRPAEVDPERFLEPNSTSCSKRASLLKTMDTGSLSTTIKIITRNSAFKAHCKTVGHIEYHSWRQCDEARWDGLHILCDSSALESLRLRYC